MLDTLTSGLAASGQGGLLAMCKNTGLYSGVISRKEEISPQPCMEEGRGKRQRSIGI